MCVNQGFILYFFLIYDNFGHWERERKKIKKLWKKYCRSDANTGILRRGRESNGRSLSRPSQRERSGERDSGVCISQRSSAEKARPSASATLWVEVTAHAPASDARHPRVSHARRVDGRGGDGVAGSVAEVRLSREGGRDGRFSCHGRFLQWHGERM